MLRFTTRQLLAVMLALSLVLAIAVPFGWLGAVLLAVALPMATYTGAGTLVAFRMSRVTSLALTVFATCMAVMFAWGAFEQPRHRAHPQVFLIATMAVAGIVWLLLVFLAKGKPALNDPPQGTTTTAGAEPSADQAQGDEHW
jgi:hypothetical protein